MTTAAPSTTGLVLVHTGDGKGKTTAALGMVFRALGHGKRVAVVQFIKGKWKTGERLFAAKLAESIPDFEFHVMGLGFTWESDDLSRDRAAARAAWAKGAEYITAGRHDLVVLDEITYGFHCGFFEVEEVLRVLRARPAHVHVVLTGRNAPEPLLELADLVTDMTLVKHPYARGIRAQIGVDF